MNAVTNSTPQTGGWQFWIDRGGTFTDIIGIAPDGAVSVRKLLSEAPGHYADAAIAGIDSIRTGRPGPLLPIDSVRIGTTVGTNALLERRGARTALITTAGLGDILRIGTQQRPNLFALDIRLPTMLHERIIEAPGRIGADGRELNPLDEQALMQSLQDARTAGIESVAIAFLHGYKFPAHEKQAAMLAAAAGFSDVVTSHALSGRARLIERGRTTVADAYLSPIVRRYVRGVAALVRERTATADLSFMQSNGGLIDAGGFRGYNSVLSGPAGGVVGMAASSAAAGFSQVIGFDMGGTSTDVALFAGDFERTPSTEVAGTSIAVPTMRINTVAAGGGSILQFRDGRLQVGPASAGAQPGPAGYGQGGPPTLTDANVFLGRIQPDYFPHVFGPQGDAPIDAALAAAAIAGLADSLPEDAALEADELAAGCLSIAVSQMAAAIEQISTQRGHDPREFALSCFGGAGGQHACLVAEALGIRTVLVDPYAGVLSAFGIGIADSRRIETAPVELPLGADALDTARIAAEGLRARIQDALSAAPDRTTFECRLLLRAGTSETVLGVSWNLEDPADAIARRFDEHYREQFGFPPHTGDVHLDAVELEGVATLPKPARQTVPDAATAATPATCRRVWVGGTWQDTPVFERSRLGAGNRVAGPAMIVEDNGTTVIESSWQAELGSHGVLVLTRQQSPGSESAMDGAATDGGAVQRDPIRLEIFNRQFVHIAEQMGAVLEQTAESVNICERLDYSCALFDASGALIANAPHVPVHLGSMSDSVRAVLDRFDTIAPGDAFVLNAPYSGGTHLPDITVVTPVFLESPAQPAFVVASRAHHADIGGLTPGSMPSHSRSIEEEGIVLEPMRIVANGDLLETELRARLLHGPHPARNVDRNIADLRAQLAANARGIRELERLIARTGIDRVRAYTRFVQDNAAECVSDAISRLSDGRHVVELDGGERVSISVRVNHDGQNACIDFAGSSGTHQALTPTTTAPIDTLAQ